MFRLLSLLFVICCSLVNASAGEWRPIPDWQGLYVFGNTCNTWLLKQGEAGLVIDPGDCTWSEHLQEIGVKKIDWILLTSHHRELHQGISALDLTRTQIAASDAERELFESPTQFRRWHPKLGDKYTVHGASYVRPPASPLKVQRWLKPDDALVWNDITLICKSTPGHSPGGMSYLLQRDGKTALFSGGLMHDGAKFTNWFDTEWDYGFAKGIDALAESASQLAVLKPTVLFSSSGPVIERATEQLRAFHDRLGAFRADYIRGYPVESLGKRGMHPEVKPTAVPMVVQVTPHLYMFGPEMAGKNFSIIIADNGHALLLDCGLFPRLVLQKLVSDMKQHLGLKQIDACWISHMHGDHFTLAPTLKEMGVELWTMDSIVDKCENPRAYDYPALIHAYGDGFDGIKIDRVLKAGDVIKWQGYSLHIDWMPGQTEFGNTLWLELDGKKIVFSGDNLFGDPSDEKQDGHECVVARNSAIIDEGYLVAARYLKQLKPDIIMGAHSVLMTDPAAFVERFESWAERMIQGHAASDELRVLVRSALGQRLSVSRGPHDSGQRLGADHGEELQP
jgi:glyoxylase-like metal-dependent hydrolase (beta-lactamase superfamily II)